MSSSGTGTPETRRSGTEPAVCRALRPFGTSIFTEMSALARACGAVNLSQGSPDFDGPEEIRRAAAEAILRGPNQYPPTQGLPALRRAVAGSMRRFHGVEVDPETEVTVMAGASESLAATLLALLEPGDRVILFDPAYDLYPPMCARAGATAVRLPLAAPDYRLDADALAAAMAPGTKAIVINNPQNPCGKVWSREELEIVAALAAEHDAIVIGDEVYEHLVFDGRRHVTLLDVAGLRQRAVVISSTAKTFSMTGWKVGWAVACPRLSAAVRMSHQFLTFCTPGALQEAMAGALGMGDGYYGGLLADYTRRRDRLCGALEELGLAVRRPEGTYFCTLDISGLGRGDDLEFSRYLAHEAGVACIPNSFFFEDRRGGRDTVRLCFCKSDAALDEAIARLRRWRSDG
jgi:N-succinyldiaminopimelate aminotransferase